MRFWVVSPNVENNGHAERWIEAIHRNNCVYMGRETEQRSKKEEYYFHDAVRTGDVILVAQGAAQNKKAYFAGFVDSDVKEVTPADDGVPSHAYARKLKGMVGESVLAELKLNFNGATCGEAAPLPAIYELHQGWNENDCEIVKKLTEVLGKAAERKLANAPMEAWISLLEKSKNLILIGAPGTGKTTLAKQIAQKMIFGEAWVLKDEKDFTEEERRRFSRCSGFIQFHPSYDYTDLVEGLRPSKHDESAHVGFARKDGIFKTFCKRALRGPNNGSDKERRKFVFIIDEINRGEISKIFGELFFSVDPGYRGETGRVQTKYANLIEEDDVFKDGFFVPENVFIIGTMNDIDRGVESFDFAMRRRFVFKEITAAESAASMNLPENVRNRMTALNTAISGIDGLNSSYQIGAAYFLKDGEAIDDFDELWNLRLEPLLKEYLRGAPDVGGDIEKLKTAYWMCR